MRRVSPPLIPLAPIAAPAAPLETAVKNDTLSAAPPKLSHATDLSNAFEMKAQKLPNFSFVISGQVAASGCPKTAHHLNALRNYGIRAIITLTEKPLDQLLDHGASLDPFDLYHLPTHDSTALTLEDLHRGVEIIARCVHDEVPVLVHCAAGNGRTGMLLAAFLLSDAPKDPTLIINTLRRLRPGSVETQSHHSALFKYAQQLIIRDEPPLPR